jgi:glyoxylase-like metal-dependent hydrolase (beta-lactamase superfamily II)
MRIHYLAGVGYDSNVYLIEDQDPMVVDAGSGMFAAATLEGMSKIVPLKRIGRIVLTHCHFDHLGGAARFQKATGGRVYLHEAEAMPIMAGDDSLTISGMFGAKTTDLDIEPLKTGQKLSTGAAELEVLHTPGHSPGSIVLHDKASSSAVVGDTLFCDGGVGRWDLPGGNLAELMSSLKQVQALGLKNMYPGHGPYTEGDAMTHIRLAEKYIEEGY